MFSDSFNCSRSWLVFLGKGGESLEKLEIFYQNKNNSEEFETEEFKRRSDEENEDNDNNKDKNKENVKDEVSCWNCHQCDPKV